MDTPDRPASSLSLSSRPNTATTSCSTLYGRRKLKEEAEAEISNLATEADVLECLWEAKPAYLFTSDGGDLWIDQKNVDEKIEGMKLKFKVNSFPDRAERFDYLQSVLKQKWANKPDVYKSMMCFLIEMSDRPTQNLDLKVETTLYSTGVEVDPDGTDIVLYGEELRQSEIKKEQFRKEVVEDLLEGNVKISYSSDEDLSDWGSSPSDDEDKETNRKEPTPIVKPKPKPALRNLVREKHEKAAAVRFWVRQTEQAAFNIKTHLRHVEPSPLLDQPVISSLTALYTRFGEHWEWKKASLNHQRPSKFVISENDIIRELIWQFTCPNTKGSVIFTEEWTLRSEIILKSSTHGALHNIVTEYGQTLSKFHRMRQFIKICSVMDSYPQIFEAYAHALSIILNSFTSTLDKLERCLKMETNPATATESSRPPSTLIQLNQILQPIIAIVDTLDNLHNQAICIAPSTPNWLKALRLISAIELHLRLDMNTSSYGLVLFIFKECLPSFLNQILKPLELKEWDDNESFCLKSPMRITDANFWNQSVTPQPIEEEMKKLNIRPLTCLDWIISEMLTMLKVQEIMIQLEAECLPDYKLLTSLPSYSEIVTKFLTVLMNEDDEKQVTRIQQNGNLEELSSCQELDRRLHYLGLNDSILCEAFHTILNEEDNKRKCKVELECDRKYILEKFYNMTSIPVVDVSHTLQSVIKEIMDPYFRHGHSSLCKLFQQYKIKEAILLLQEIVFGGKEEFALACIQLAYKTRMNELQTGRSVDEEEEDLDTIFQNMLDFFYPDGRESFEIDFFYESKSATNFVFKIRPLFPLTLLITQKTIAHYELIAREISKIRKGLWLLNRLRPKDCKPGLGVEINRILCIRFCILQFWSSLRSYILINAFDAAEIPTFNEESSIDKILKAYEVKSGGSLYRILSFKMFESVIIKPILHSTITLSKNWYTGISVMDLAKLSARVRAAWDTTLQFGGSAYSPELNQLAQFFAPIPDFL